MSYFQSSPITSQGIQNRPVHLPKRINNALEIADTTSYNALLGTSTPPPNVSQINITSHRLPTRNQLSEHSKIPYNRYSRSIPMDEHFDDEHRDNLWGNGTTQQSSLAVERTTSHSNPNTIQVGYSRRVGGETFSRRSRSDISPKRRWADGDQPVPISRYDRVVESAKEAPRKSPRQSRILSVGTKHNSQGSESILRGDSSAMVHEHAHDVHKRNTEVKPSGDQSQLLRVKLERESSVRMSLIPDICHLNANEQKSTSSRNRNDRGKKTKSCRRDPALFNGTQNHSNISEGSSNGQKGKRKGEQNDELSLASKRKRGEKSRDRVISSDLPQQNTSREQTLSFDTMGQQATPTGSLQADFVWKRVRARSMPPKFNHDISKSVSNGWNKFTNELSHELNQESNSSWKEGKPTGSATVEKNMMPQNILGQAASLSNLPQQSPRTADQRPSDRSGKRTNYDMCHSKNMSAGGVGSESHKKGVYNLNIPLAIRPIGNSNNGFRPPIIKRKF
jgi:hypothetical protein